MSLGYILNTVAADCGITLDTNTRAYLLSKVNEAAREVYRRRDLPIALKEVYIRATANRELALPPFVGELRAVRAGCNSYCTNRWQLTSLYPRYNKEPWAEAWNRWRDKGVSPVAIEWENTAPGTITYPVEDEDLTITIVGETTNSNRAVDNIVVSATSVNWSKTFLNITRIAKNKITDYNVVLSDADGNECAIIYADQLEASYKLVDVSEYPSTGMGEATCPDGTQIMELLYKPILPILSADTDTFPVPGCDDMLIIKTKQLLAEQAPGQEQRAILMDQKADKLARELVDDRTGHIKKKMTIKKSSYLDICYDGYRRHF